jgi:(1->4)-alpha-D-glucan 1-alpha-D-glucosylmutase
VNTVAAAGRVPRATYRLQFNRHFTFGDATEIVPYLAALGISDLYASPYLRAREGSLHGYDISDHGSLNPDIGLEDEHEALTTALAEHGMGHLLDIVPNHMGIAESGNRWWRDVLENGPSSPYAPFFDIDWRPLKPELRNKVLLPVLGDHFGAVLESGDLRLSYGDGRFQLGYHEHEFPVAPKSGEAILAEALDRLDLATDHPERMELESIVRALEHLPTRHQTDPASSAERRREKVVTERRLRILVDESPAVRSALESALDVFNGDPVDPASFDRLERLLEDQAYRLAFWRVAAEEINYRRFFDINDLAGVRVELPEVFDATHRLILSLVREGKVTGLRIDHPDGLYDPREYLIRLQREGAHAEGGGPFYVVVEKILTADEELPSDWPVAGTVGYDVLRLLDGVLVPRSAAEPMERVYRRFVGRIPEFGELAYSRKKLILRAALSSELNVLAYHLNRISEQHRRTRDFTLGNLRDTLREVIACFPVYRTYVDAHREDLSPGDTAHVRAAVREARRRNPATSASVFQFLTDILLLRWPEGLSAEERAERARFVMKFQQLTGPVMAKGVEDTTFYIYNRLVSLNEVGGEPHEFGLEPEAFHEAIRRRAERWPHALVATSTHDTKRSEDVRARIHALAEIPVDWEEHARRWGELNAPHRLEEDGLPVPDPNDEYLLYQTLVGAWPLDEMHPDLHREFVGRVQQYMEKATREAKFRTSWINPHEEYDRGLRDFVERVLRRSTREDPNPFLEDLVAFQRRIAPAGMVNALTRTVVKHTVPGVPDVYQGQELWDFSLVDPDNRRPVDFRSRAEALAALREREGEGPALAAELQRGWTDGRIKLWLIHRLLRLRQDDPELFSAGTYEPLWATGDAADHALSFARAAPGRRLVTVATRLPLTLMGEREGQPLGSVWGDTRIRPGEGRGTWTEVLTGREFRVEGGEIPLRELLDTLPVAVLLRSE